MATQIPEQVALSASTIDDGCVKFQIFSPVSASDNLITTISSSQLLEGFSLSGSNVQSVYTLTCLDSSGVAQGSAVVQRCVSGSNGEDPVEVEEEVQECNDTVTYSGNQTFPGIYEVDLGYATGSVTVTYQAYSVPDKFVVDWSGSTVFNSGYVGSVGNQTSLNTNLSDRGYDPETITNVSSLFGGLPGYGSGSFEKTTAEPTTCQIRVYAPLPGTAWQLTVDCPDGEETSTEYTASVTPDGGGACLTGTTTVTGVCMPGQTGLTETGTFTLANGYEATVRMAGTFYSGYGSVGLNQTSGQQTAQLLDNNDNVVQNFVMVHEQGTAPGSSTYHPASYKITTPGTYKLRVYHLGCDDGNGTVGLYVDSCVEASNYETTRDTSVGTTAGVGVGTSFKVVWDTYQYQDAIDAQNLGKWLTGRSSISQNVWYGLDTSLINGGGFKVFDSTPTEEGDVNLLSNSQMRYVNDGLEYFVEVKNVSASGNMHTAFTANDQHKFRKG